MISSLVLLPTYNEQKNLPDIVERLFAFEDVDVLVIDDDSPDGTGLLADRLRMRFAHLSVLHRREKEGLGRAYVAGFTEALRRGYRRIVTMDADLSHAPEDVPRLIEALESADVAVGSRHVAGGGVLDWPLRRRLLSRAGSLYARMLLRLGVSDATSGFRAYRAEAVEDLDLGEIHARGFVFQVEILRRILDEPGRRVVEVPILFRNRSRGRSKISAEIVSEAIRRVLVLSMKRRGRRRQARGAGRRRGVPERPLVSAIVPSVPENRSPAALGQLAALDDRPGQLEVIVAWGRCPSRQRNQAALQSRGEYLLFLDDDSEISPGLVERYSQELGRKSAVAAVGGPAVPLERCGSFFQRLAALALSEPWAVGRSAARYAARGELREVDERELILCNLCVRRSAFTQAGGFDETLYPNEENELLERLRRSGWKLIYDPEATVERPHRRGVKEQLHAVFSYGRGRARQMRRLCSRTSLGRLLTVALAASILLSAAAGWLGGPGVLKLAASLPVANWLLLAWKLSVRGGPVVGPLAAALACLSQAAYGAGLICGLAQGFPRVPQGPVEIERLLAGGAEPRAARTSSVRLLQPRGNQPRGGRAPRCLAPENPHEETIHLRWESRR